MGKDEKKTRSKFHRDEIKIRPVTNFGSLVHGEQEWYIFRIFEQKNPKNAYGEEREDA